MFHPNFHACITRAFLCMHSTVKKTELWLPFWKVLLSHIKSKVSTEYIKNPSLRCIDDILKVSCFYYSVHDSNELSALSALLLCQGWVRDDRLPNGVRRLEEEHTQCGLMAKLEEDGSGCRRCVQVGVMVSPLKSLDNEKTVYEVHMINNLSGV